MDTIAYQTADHFYAAHTARHGGEVDFGCFWTAPADAGRHDVLTWRVSYITNTGEVYATDGTRYALLGRAGSEARLVGLLRDWATPCLARTPFTWVTERLRGHVYKSGIHAARAWAKRNGVVGRPGGYIYYEGKWRKPICQGWDSLAHSLVSSRNIVLAEPKQGILSPAWIEGR